MNKWQALNKAVNYQRTSKLTLVIAALLSGSVVAADSPQSADSEKLAERLSQLEQRLSQLEGEAAHKDKVIKALEHSATTSSSTVLIAAEPTTRLIILPVTQQKSSHQFDAPDKSITLSNSTTTLQIGGQIWLDVMYNNGDMTNKAGFQPSSIAYEEGTVNDKVLFSVGQSKLFIKSYSPTQYGQMSTRFEFDMFQSDGNAGFHLAHLWGELGAFGAGKTFSGFMDINAFPNTLEYWGPNSMVFTRQPQVRYTNNSNKNGVWIITAEQASSAFATPNNVPVSDNQYHGVNNFPDLTASYQHNGDFGYIKAAFITRKLGFDSDYLEGDAMGWGLNVSGAIKVSTADTIKFQFVYGEGLGRYLNDACCSYYADETGGSDAGLDENFNLVAIPVAGGFAYYDKQWNQQWTSSVGVSYLTVDNLATQLDKSYHSSVYTTANLIWTPTGFAKLGLELQYGEVESKSGLKADNFRVQTSAGFKY